MGQRGVPDLLGPAQGVPHDVCIAPSIPVRVANLRPLRGRAVALGDLALVVEPRRAQITGDVERQRSPVELQSQLVLQRKGVVHGDECEGTLEVDVYDQRRVGNERIELGWGVHVGITIGKTRVGMAND